VTALEDALAATFTERANRSVVNGHDLAARAMAAGQAQRRRRMTGLATITVFCLVVTASLVVVVGTGGALHGGPGADLQAAGTNVALSSPMPPSNLDLPVDYVRSEWLYLRSGRSVKLPSGNVTQVQRAGDGFVVVEQGQGDEEQRAWYVNERTGTPVMVLDNVTSVAVSTDGSGRAAWLDGSKMYYQATVVPVYRVATNAQVTALPVAKPIETARPSAGRPIGFVGDAVLLADFGQAQPGEADAERHDLWFPARGDYVPTWANFFAVYGVRAGTELVVARYHRKGVCLALVRMKSFTIDDDQCHYIDQTPKRGWVSPSGRWLVVADQHEAQMFDLFAGWSREAQVKWSVDRVGTDAAWLDRDTVALHTSSGVVVLSPFANTKAVEYKLPGLSLIVSQ
jgi:hypothetical protein